MIRVLNIISDTNIGGAGRVILNYLACADRTAFHTMVAVPRGSLLKEPLEQAGAEVLEVDGIADRSYNKEDIKTLKTLLNQVKPDLVHTHGCLSGRIAARRCHLPVVYSRHSAFPVPAKLKYPPGRWVNGWINGHYADKIITVSPATAENLTDGGVSPKKIVVVMNGVTPLTPIPEAEKKELRASLNLPEHTVVFGILARIEDYKGHLYLVEAARLLKERGYSDFRVLIAGTGTFEDTVSQAIQKSRVEDVVQMLGFRSDVNALLSILDVQLNASYVEATSIALLEGMSLGLPSVVSDCGGNPWLVKEGENGLLFPSRNSEALANAMAKLIDEKDTRLELGQRARQVFEERFTGQAFARATEQVYRDVLEGGT